MYLSRRQGEKKHVHEIEAQVEGNWPVASEVKDVPLPSDPKYSIFKLQMRGDDFELQETLKGSDTSSELPRVTLGLNSRHKAATSTHLRCDDEKNQSKLPSDGRHFKIMDRSPSSSSTPDHVKVHVECFETRT